MFTRLLAVRRRQGGGASTASGRWQAAGVAIWLFSPFTVAISTRGNGEALVSCMLLGMLLALQAGESGGTCGTGTTRPRQCGLGLLRGILFPNRSRCDLRACTALKRA